jgi:hypothetical protein
MRFYTKQHQFYCSIDLHARTMYVCIMDHEETIPPPAHTSRFSGGPLSKPSAAKPIR